MRFFILFIVGFYCYSGLSQVSSIPIDSLNKLITQLKKEPHSFKNDTTLVTYLTRKSNFTTTFGTSEEGIQWAQEAIDLSEKIGWKKGIIIANFTMGEAYHVKSQYFTAIKYFLKVLDQTTEKDYDNNRLKSLRHIGGSYMWMERPVEALKYYKEFEKESFGKSSKESFILDGYTEMGQLQSRFLNNPKKGMEYFLKTEKEYIAVKDTLGIAYVNSYMGGALAKLNQPEKALKALEKAIKFYKAVKTDYLLADAYIFSSEFFLEKKNYEKSKFYAAKAQEIAEKLKIYFSIRDSHKLLYLNEKATGNYKAALFHHEIYANSRDSMAEANIDDRLKVINYDTDTKLQKAEIDKKTRENERKNTLIFGLIAGLVALTIISFLIYRFLNIRKKNAENEVIQLQQEKQLIASNSVIKGQEEERGRLAKDLHDGLGGILSGVKLTLNSMTGNQVLSEQNSYVFHKAIGQLDTAISELRRVAHSMMPEALLKFGLSDAIQDYCEGINESGKLKVNFEAWGLDGRQEQSVEVNLYRIVQELLNNTMKHAQATFAHVQLVQNENMITLTVEDNGKGFDVSNLHKNKGAGITNVESRVAYLNGKLDIKSDPSHGTSVEVQVIVS
jgi:two-component system, NarL family, sensor kinase